MNTSSGLASHVDIAICSEERSRTGKEGRSSNHKDDAVVVTSLEGAVAKYCNTYVCVCVCDCVCVCLSAMIYPEPLERSLPFFASCFWPWLGRAPEGGEISRGAILGGFLPIDNALYSRALGIHTITTEPIEMPFGMMSGLCLRNIVLRGGDNHDSSNAATVD